jgi:hypothetical protein
VICRTLDYDLCDSLFDVFFGAALSQCSKNAALMRLGGRSLWREGRTRRQPRRATLNGFVNVRSHMARR